MSNYSSTFTKTDGATVEAADFSTEFNAIAAASASKYDAANLARGTLTVALSGTAAHNDNVISHGLGTDDIDFGGTFYHDSGIVNTVFSTAAMQGSDNRYALICGGGNIGTANTPASGQIFAHFTNTATTTGNYVLKWWARKR